MVDDVFTEPDAFQSAKMRVTLGRIYEQWKRTRKAMDPGFDHRRYKHKEVQRRRLGN